MYKLGRTSKKNLKTCKNPIQKVINKAITLGLIDFSVVEGIRSRTKQNKYYYMIPQKSKVRWPYSKHNVIDESKELSEAADIVPYINSKSSYNYYHCCYLAGIILATGLSLGIKLRWGGNWDMDGEPITDQNFQDLVHYEMV